MWIFFEGIASLAHENIERQIGSRNRSSSLIIMHYNYAVLIIKGIPCGDKLSSIRGCYCSIVGNNKVIFLIIYFTITIIYYYCHFKNTYREGKNSHEIQTQILITLPLLHFSNSQNFSNGIPELQKSTVCNFQFWQTNKFLSTFSISGFKSANMAFNFRSCKNTIQYNTIQYNTIQENKYISEIFKNSLQIPQILFYFLIFQCKFFELLERSKASRAVRKVHHRRLKMTFQGSEHLVYQEFQHQSYILWISAIFKFVITHIMCYNF